MSPVTRDVLQAIHQRNTGPNPGSDLFGTVDSFAQTQAETNTGVKPASFSASFAGYDLKTRLGLVPNDITKATANTTLLKGLLDPSKSGITGTIFFPNTTGSDIYYFNGVIGIRDWISILLMGCALSCTMTGSAADNQCGFLNAQRHFHIEGGTILFNYTAGGGNGNNGNHFFFGGRGTDCPLFPAVYDSLLAEPLGDISVSRIKLGSAANINTSRCFLMLGGLENVEFKNITMDGGGVMGAPLYYEFGYATNPVAPNHPSARQTSHMHNFNCKNIAFKNFVGVGQGWDGNGAYGVTLDGIWANNTTSIANWGIGESRFFKPQNPNDIGGARHAVHIKNVYAYNLNNAGGTAVSVTGSNGSNVNTGYLGQNWTATTAYGVGDIVYNSPNLYVCTQAGTSAGSGGPSGTGTGIVDNTAKWNYQSLAASTDLLDTLIENVNCIDTSGLSGGYGVRLNGCTRATVRGCFFNGMQRGVVTDQETTLFAIYDNIIRDSLSFGIEIGLGISIYGTVKGTPRQAVGRITGNFIAGSLGAAAIATSQTQQLVIEDNRFGYEAIHDDDHPSGETTQFQAVTADSTSFGVVCRRNYVAGTNGVAAFNLAGTTSRNCRLEGNSYNATVTTHATGAWLGDNPTGAITFTPGSGIGVTPDCAGGNQQIIVQANAAAFAIVVPLNPPDAPGFCLIFTLRNTSGGALGVVSWNAIYKMAAWTNPATGNSRSIMFSWNGTNWVEVNRTAADVPN